MSKHSYITPKVEVRRSGIDRRGVFCIRPIRKDEIICVWGGYIITDKEFDRLSRKEFKNIDDYATVLAEGFYLVSSKKGGLEDDDFFNHSCEPNAGVRGQVMMVAMRDIRAGEEVTYDYCMTDAGFDFAFDCGCGAKSCRRRVTTSDWKKPSLQKKYKGYFSWYIQSKIDKKNK
ncbi:MAG: SET domain-containing protein [Deltaproteobacteria bacterium]